MKPASIEIFDKSISPHKQDILGTYSRELRKIDVVFTGNKDEFFNTLVHEMNHQIFEDRVDNSPRWILEGLAQYHSISKDKITYGDVKYDELKKIAKAAEDHKIIRLEDLLKSDKCFKEENRCLAYAESWSFVYFLIKTNRFAHYYANIKAGKRIFADCSEIKMLESLWANHLDNLLLKSSNKKITNQSVYCQFLPQE